MVQYSNGSIQLYFWADRNVSEEYRMILPFLLLQWETRICLIKKPSRTEPKVGGSLQTSKANGSLVITEALSVSSSLN